MKKLMTVLLGILVAATALTAALTDNGEIAANISQTTAVAVTAYPTNTTTGTPAAISDGTGVAGAIVVQGVTIDDNSINGWDLQVDSANSGVLINQTDGTTTIAYTLDMSASTGGTLGAGLAITAASPLVLNGGAGSEAITATGTATIATTAYAFNLTMDIANGATTGKLAGDYTDTITLTINSND